jgi:hypothetical protein
MLVDAWCLCLRAWLPFWQISLFGMSEYSNMMAGILTDLITDMDAKEVEPLVRARAEQVHPHIKIDLSR